MRVFISADMEGVTGLVAASELLPDGPDYPHFRALMTADVNAAAETSGKQMNRKDAKDAKDAKKRKDQRILSLRFFSLFAIFVSFASLRFNRFHHEG